MKEIFTQIYKTNEWKSKESVSGEGSELRTTIEIREQLPKIFNRYHIRRVLDLGCGDFNWMAEIAPKLEKYLGLDVVEEIIINNQQKYSTNKIQFSCVDVSKVNNLNDYDAIIIRDVFVHFSFLDIWTVLDKIMKCDSKYLFTTSFMAETMNRDIPTGTWRRLNFMLPPFNFPSPMETIVSYSEPYKDVNKNTCMDKTLSMWDIRLLKTQFGKW